MDSNQSTTQGASLLVVVAHLDDAEIWCGGALVKHSRLEDATIVVRTDCDTRKREGLKGAYLLGAQLLTISAITKKTLVKVITEKRPAIVITHSIDDFHPDHRAVADVCIAAIKDTRIRTGLPLRLYFCDTYNSLDLHGLFAPSVILDISDVYPIKIEAIKAHASQAGGRFIDMAIRQNGLWGARVGVRWGEAFKAVPILGQLSPSQEL